MNDEQLKHIIEELYYMVEKEVISLGKMAEILGISLNAVREVDKCIYNKEPILLEDVRESFAQVQDRRRYLYGRTK